MLFSKFFTSCVSNIENKMASGKRGALIIIEGVDRSGKSTQCKKLVQALTERNIEATLMNFPDRTTLTGKLIDEYLRNQQVEINDHTIHLLFSANRWENLEKIKSLLYGGITLVVDRYSYSGIVFSAVKKNMDLQWCQHPENGLPKPDLVFLLTLSQEELLARPEFGNERYENLSFQNDVAKMFRRVCDEENNWLKINASGTIDEVHKKLLDASIKKIAEVELAPLETLNFGSSKKS